MSSLTENEARTKWCPFVRCGGLDADGVSDSGINRHVILRINEENPNPTYSRCIGRECMMWISIKNTEDKDLGRCGLSR